MLGAASGADQAYATSTGLAAKSWSGDAVVDVARMEMDHLVVALEGIAAAEDSTYFAAAIVGERAARIVHARGREKVTRPKQANSIGECDM